jgi:hypothetical protein
MMTLTTPHIPLDTLLESGRVARPLLRAWAATILQTLERLRAQAGAWLDITGCMNNASLIEVFRGQPRGAFELCELQLRWAERLVGEQGLLSAGDLMLQPWINEGRLLRIQGDHAGALKHFSLLPEALAGRPVQVGAITVDGATFRALVDERSLWTFLRGVYVVDGVRTYIAAGNHAQAVTFLRETTSIMGGAPFALLDEMELVVLARLGRYREALDITERSTWQADGYTKMVRVTYRIAFLSALGSREAACGLAEQLAERVLAGTFASPKDQRVLRYLHHFGELTRHLELDAVATPVFQTGLSASRHLVDVPLEISFLEFLLALEGIAERNVLLADRDARLRECLYVTLLKPRGLEVEPSAAADPVFHTLRSKLEEMAGIYTNHPLIEACAA